MVVETPALKPIVRKGKSQCLKFVLCEAGTYDGGNLLEFRVDVNRWHSPRVRQSRLPRQCSLLGNLDSDSDHLFVSELRRCGASSSARCQFSLACRVPTHALPVEKIAF
jgi:hypothetical protein